MTRENLEIGQKLDYADYPELFGKELTFAQLAQEPSSSLLLIWRAARVRSSMQDVKGATVCRIERVEDDADGDPEWATVYLDLGGKKSIDFDCNDFDEPRDVPDDERERAWNWYDRIWRVAAPTLAETAGAAPEIQEAEIVPQEAAPLAGTPAAEALALHSRILANISVMAQSMTQMCRDLREMRDSQLYRQMGYSSFEAYTEKEIGIKRRQAYTYVQIAERLPEDFIEQSAQLGVQKLALLASATEEQRELIIRDTDISETTVRELKEKLRGLKIQPAKAEPEQEQLPGQMTFVPEDSTETHTETGTGTSTGIDTETDTGTDTDTDTGTSTDTQTAQKQPFHAEKSVESIDSVEEEFQHYLKAVENALDDICIFLENSGKGTKEMNQKLWRMLIDYAGSLES